MVKQLLIINYDKVKLICKLVIYYYQFMTPEQFYRLDEMEQAEIIWEE